MNKVFFNKDFWLLYRQLENKDIGKDEMNNFLELLGEDYNTDTIEYDDGELVKSVKFSFDCGDTYLLCLDVSFYMDSADIDKYLYLANKKLYEEYLLGWWDMARWHPYCIKPDELELLTAYWQKMDTEQTLSIPYLLLNDFVGITKDEEGIKLRQIEKEMFEQLKVYDERIVSSVDPNGDKREQILNSMGYEWISDSELGWLFTSNEYSCYSLRNRDHIKSNCGTFPFKHWNIMINDLTRTL